MRGGEGLRREKWLKILSHARGTEQEISNDFLNDFSLYYRNKLKKSQKDKNIIVNRRQINSDFSDLKTSDVRAGEEGRKMFRRRCLVIKSNRFIRKVDDVDSEEKKP